ncbi:MAG: SusC/RagA family TonB-linked outer membrane protein, partial [Bacteroidia bacterium]
MTALKIKCCTWLKITMLAIIIFPFSFHGLAQNTKLITGIVSETQEGVPMAGVNVLVKGTRTGTITDEMGKFSIRAGNSDTLEISFSGYRSQQIPIGSKASFNITLARTASTLDEVVVVGYQTVKRRDLTGSVSSISSEQLKDIPINSTAQALAGRLAGVQVISSDGEPGADVNIVIRGGGSITQSNAPLYIIDGLEVEDGLSAISPSDIESIDVLKDAASTAIYGARGGNGVVLITTKGGKAMKTQVIYEGFVGVRSFNRRLEVMDPYNFVLRQYEGSRGSSSNEVRFKELYGDWDKLDSYRAVTGEDWQQRLFGRDAMMQNHDIRVVGGTENTKFNIGFRRSTEDGVMLGSDFGRNQVNLRFDHNANKLKVGLNMRYSDQVVNGAGVAEEGQGNALFSLPLHATYSLLRHAVKYSPVLDPGVDINQADEDYYNGTGGGAVGILNPIEQGNAWIQEELKKKV